MQVSVQAGEGLKRELRVDLPAEDIEGEVDKRLQRFARTARIPGFRPGKVPVRVIRQQYGDQVRGEVFGEMVQATFPLAVQQENLSPAGMPDIEPDIDQKSRRYGYTASFEVFPSIELKSFSGNRIKQPQAEITEADVDQMIERLRQQRKTWQDVERAAQRGDRLTVSFEGRIDGEVFEGGKAENFPIELGAGRMIPGFEEQLLDAKVGEQREFDLRFPDDYQAEHLRGRDARFSVEVQSVSEPQLPEVDAAFITEMGVTSGDLSDFRNDVRDTMGRELKQRIDDIVKERVIQALIEDNPVELPETLVGQEARSLRDSLSKAIGGQTVPLPEDFYLDSARRRVATGLLINEAVKHYELSVDEEAVRQKINELAEGYERPQDVINYYLKNQDGLSQIRARLLEDLVVARLLQDAEIEEEPTTFSELTESSAQQGD